MVGEARTRRANEDAWGWSAAAVIAPKKVVNKKVKLVKGLIKNVPHVTRAELDGDFSASEVTAAPVLPVVSSVEELFGDEAERWVKDESAVDSDGDEVEPTAPEAYAFCLSGAVTRVYGEGTDAEAQACDKLTDVIDKYSFGEFRDLPGFNDDNNTTFEDIRRVVALAGV